MSVYTFDWRKYRGISLFECSRFQTELKRTFHNCPYLMEKKEELERLVRNSSHCEGLKKHFKMDYRNRKDTFYKKILDIAKEPYNIKEEILKLTRDILFIYSEKQKELNYLDELSEKLYSELSSYEEEYEYYSEKFKEYN